MSASFESLMRVTLLGHASTLVEVEGRNVLIDPVFGDSFAEGALVPCPSRRVHVERLPRIDLVVLTQGALDHFDVASLARLPRDCKILCPNHGDIVYALEKLGFTMVRTCAPNTLLKLGKFDVLMTASLRHEAELGVVLQDQTGTFWHQSDTVLAPQIVETVRATMGRIDLLFAAYAVEEFAYIGAQRGPFPAEHLDGAVACARHVAPVLTVPASSGFRYAEPLAWANAFVFPISRERFLRELARVAPDRPSAMGLPGDVFEISKHGVDRHAGASRVAETLEDDTHRIEFDPTALVPPVVDPNLDGYPADVLAREVEATFDSVEAFVRDGYQNTEPVVAEHRRTRMIYGLGIVFPDGHERWWSCRFSPDAPSFERGDGRIRHLTSTHRLPASVVVARARYERRYDFAGGLCRLSVLGAASLVDGKVVLEAREQPDLLFHVLRTRAPGAEANGRRHLDFRLAPFVAARGSAA